MIYRDFRVNGKGHVGATKNATRSTRLIKARTSISINQMHRPDAQPADAMMQNPNDLVVSSYPGFGLPFW